MSGEERRKPSAEIMVNRIGLWLGPALFAAILGFVEPEGLSTIGIRVMAVTVWTAVWWVTEALPVNVTALLPFLLFPLTGVMDAGTVAKATMDHSVYLFLGGFFLAAALETWGLHRRLALRALVTLGTSPRRLILGVMIIVAFLSMWLTNTATTVMMLPILLAVLAQAESRLGEGPECRRFGAALLVGTALAANIGGMGTPIGTVPNVLLVRHAEAYGGITFLEWMKVGVPVVMVLVPVTWFLMVNLTIKVPRDLQVGDVRVIRDEYRALGSMTTPEKRLSAIFALGVVLWITRKDLDFSANWTLPGWASTLEWIGVLPAGVARGLSDATVAALLAILLFAVPARRGGPQLLAWERAARVPWGVLLLLGGGFALAAGFETPGPDGLGLGAWLGQHLDAFAALPSFLQILGVALLVSFLTEFASNTATCSLMLPLIFAFAKNSGVSAMPLAFAATLGASCSFMMPAATPPNALVFGTGKLPIALMVRNGALLNVVAALVLSGMLWVLA